MEKKICNFFALSYFNVRNLNFKFRKWRETHLVAYKLKTGWGNRNYIDLQIKSFSKEDIVVPSFLILHTTHTSKIAISLTLKKKEQLPLKICCKMNSNSWVCLRIDISADFNKILTRNFSQFQYVSRYNKW